MLVAVIILGMAGLTRAEEDKLTVTLNLTSDIAYNDGFGGKAHDWSYATFGLSTKLKIAENLSFVPGIYHQISMKDSICKHDVTHCILSMKYKF